MYAIYKINVINVLMISELIFLLPSIDILSFNQILKILYYYDILFEY